MTSQAESRNSIFQRNKFLVREQNLTMMSALFSTIASTTLKRVGLSALTLGAVAKHIPFTNFTEETTKLLSDVQAASVGMFIAGASAHMLLKLSRGDAVKDIQEISSEGVDRQLNNNHLDYSSTSEVPYVSDASKTLIEHHRKEIFDKLKSDAYFVQRFFNGTDHKAPYFDHEEYDRNSVNVVHMLAILGQSDTDEARIIKSAPYFYDHKIEQVFNDSEALCKALVGNMDSLMDFANEVEASLGEDAKYFIKNFKDYTKGRTEFFQIKTDAIKAACKNIQKYNVHMDFCDVVAQIMDESKTTGITPDDGKLMLETLGRFDNLKNEADPDNPFASIIEQAHEAKRIITTFANGDNNMPLHRQFAKHFEEAGIDQAMTKEAIKQQLHTHLFQSIAPKPEDFEKEVAKAMFSQMEERARASFDKVKFFDDSNRENMTDEEIKIAKKNYGLDPFDQVKHSVAAKNAVHRVQQRMLQAQVQLAEERDSRLGM